MSTSTQRSVTIETHEGALAKLVHLLLVVDHADGFMLKFLNDPGWYNINTAAALEQVVVNCMRRSDVPVKSASLNDGSHDRRVRVPGLCRQAGGARPHAADGESPARLRHGRVRERRAP